MPKAFLKHPLDILAVRLQTDVNVNTGLSSINRYKTALFTNRFTGITPSIVSQLPSSAAVFAIKDFQQPNLSQL